MYIKPRGDGEDLKVSLGEVLKILSEGKFESQGELKKYLEGEDNKENKNPKKESEKESGTVLVEEKIGDEPKEEREENKKEIEFSEKERKFLEVYKKDAEYMVKFIKEIDYIGQFGYKKEDVEKAIIYETNRFWSLYEKEILEEGYFENEKRVKEVIEKIQKELIDNNSFVEVENISEKKEPEIISEEKVETSKEEETKFEVDLSDKERQIEMIREGKIYYAEMMGREKNLEKAFLEFEKDNKELLGNYEGKDILLKVNLVDPDSSEACTNSETIKKVAELIGKYNPKKIYVGDIPSGMGKKGRSWEELRKIYEEKLGYDFEGKTELINLEDLENEIITEEGEEFEVKKLDKFGGVINISKPKMHGEFGYTGCTKNLMGFMTQKSREDSVHMAKETKEGKRYDPKVSSKRLSKFSSAILKNQPTIVNVSDGFDFIIGHEHIGIPKETNFAMVSRDPFNADNEAMNLMGLNKDRVSYINDKEFPIVEGKLDGEMTRKNISSSGLEQRVMLYETKSDGRPVFVDIINDPEFLNNLETKKRFTVAFLDLFKNSLINQMNITQKEQYLEIIENNVNGNSFEEFFRTIFMGNDELIKRNPYNNNNLPEFKDLAIAWINSQK
jgi:uncharacterized protein (DUF362 family)